MDESVTIADTPELLAERVAEAFSTLVTNTLQRQPRFTLALAGGQTPKQFYARLAKEPYRSAIPWSKLWIFWGDERCVAKDHSDSNFRMASETLLQYVPVSSAHVFRMRGEDPPPKAAREYEEQMRQVFKDMEWPEFDLILLGLGPDGHTASLIPGTPAVQEHPPVASFEERRQPSEEAASTPPRWVVNNVVRAMQTVRITMTLPTINHAKNIWFLVTGAKKAAAFAQAQQGPTPACPASLVKPDAGTLRWFVDRAVTGSATEMSELPKRRFPNRPEGGHHG